MAQPPAPQPPFAGLPVPLPPAWPAWVIAGLGLIVAIAGSVWLVAVAAFVLPVAAWIIPAVLTSLGSLTLLGGLSWLALRGLRARRHLPAGRYRGPSVLLLFSLAFFAANFLSLIPFAAALAAGRSLTDLGPIAGTALLLITPLMFAVVAGVFVLRTGALEGVPVGDGPATARNLGRGIALGAAFWVLAAVIGLILGWLFEQLTGEKPVDNQAVAVLAASLHPMIAFGLIGIAAPVVEELFFRWVAVNAWEREHGTSVALFGSALLFAFAHLFGGTLLAVPIILLLGLVLGAAYLRTRSLPLVIGMHATFNCLSVAVLFVAGV